MSVIRPNIGGSTSGVTTVQFDDDPANRTLVLTGVGVVTAAHNARIAVWAGSSGVTDYIPPSGAVRWVSDNVGDTGDILVTGVDVNYELQTETVTLDGTTPVLSAYTWRAINEAYAVTDLIGTVVCENPAATRVYAIMTADTNAVLSPNCWPMSQFSSYLVPVGYVGVVSGLQAWAAGTTAPGGISVKDWTEATPIWRPVGDWLPYIGADYRQNVLTRPMAFAEKTTIQWRSSAPDVGSITVYSMMTLTLVPQSS